MTSFLLPCEKNNIHCPGAAVGPMLAGLVSGRAGSWSYVFYMLISCDVMALILLLRYVQFYQCHRVTCGASQLSSATVFRHLLLTRQTEIAMQMTLVFNVEFLLQL